MLCYTCTYIRILEDLYIFFFSGQNYFVLCYIITGMSLIVSDLVDMYIAVSCVDGVVLLVWLEGSWSMQLTCSHKELWTDGELQLTSVVCILVLFH